MEAVHDLVRPLDLRDELAVLAGERHRGAAQHVFDDVAHAERLARRRGERDRGAVERRRIEILGPARIVVGGAVGKQPSHRPRHRAAEANVGYWHVSEAPSAGRSDGLGLESGLRQPFNRSPANRFPALAG
jgi:hypothetical protein